MILSVLSVLGGKSVFFQLAKLDQLSDNPQGNAKLTQSLALKVFRWKAIKNNYGGRQSSFAARPQHGHQSTSKSKVYPAIDSDYCANGNNCATNKGLGTESAARSSKRFSHTL